MAAGRPSGTDDFVDAVLTASRVLVAVSAQSLAKVEEAVTLVQFRTLVVLSTRPGINLTGLAETLDVNASTALRMVDRLVLAGFVARADNPAHRREVLLQLTPAGVGLVETVTARRRQEITRIVKAMPADRRAELAAALHAFAAAAGEPTVAAAGTPSAFAW